MIARTMIYASRNFPFPPTENVTQCDWNALTIVTSRKTDSLLFYLLLINNSTIDLTVRNSIKLANIKSWMKRTRKDSSAQEEEHLSSSSRHVTQPASNVHIVRDSVPPQHHSFFMKSLRMCSMCTTGRGGWTPGCDFR